MIKEILNNKVFVIILYLLGILFFIKINPTFLPPCVNKSCHHPVGIFVVLIVITIISHYNLSLGLLGALIFLYLTVIIRGNQKSLIEESFQNKEEGDDDINDENDNDDDDKENNDEDEDNLEKLEEEVKNEEEENGDDDDDDDDDDDASSEEN